MSFIVNMNSWIKQTFCFLSRGRNEDGNVKEKEANCLHQVLIIFKVNMLQNMAKSQPLKISSVSILDLQIE